jgi:two-component system, cell cycle sensor histidine kinase and response regulator CckA
MTITTTESQGRVLGARERVLVVEDDAGARQAVAELLASQGYAVVGVGSGEDALEHVGEADLVLLDGMLPGRDGWEICAQIKQEIDPLLPVVMVTGRAGPEVVARTFGVGADDYVAKPFRVSELLARIETRLRVVRAERALRESEERYRQLYQQSALMLFSVSGDGRIRLANETGAEQLGYTMAELLRASFFDIVHPDDRAAARHRLHGCFEQPARVHSWELRKLRRDGRVLWVRETGHAMTAPDGAPMASFSCIDITDRVRSERALTRSVTQMRGLARAAVEVGALRAVDDVMARITRHAATLVGTRAAAAVVGVGPDRAVAATLGEDGQLQVAEADAPICGALCWHVRRTNQPLRLRAGEIAAHPAVRAGGGRAGGAVHGWLGAPLVDAQGENLGAVCVTDKLEGEFTEADEAVLVQLARMASVAVENARLYGEIEAAEQRYRRFFEDDLTGDYIATADGRLLECNPAYARILGYHSVADALANATTTPYPSPESREELLDRLRRERMLEEVEVELRRRDGEPVHVIQNVIGSFDEAGELVQVKGYLFDITARKQLEEQFLQSQKMEVVGKLAGGVAHDFNNLLTVIRGNTALLLQDVAAGSSSHGDLQEIERAALRAGELTQQLLAFSRRQVLMPKVVDLNATVGEMDKMLRRLIGEDIELITVLDPDLSHIRVDPGQLQQVLMNLVVNARDAMPQGGTLLIETENAVLGPEQARRLAYVAPGPYVRLSVRDTGCGMSEEVQRRVFEPFFTTKAQGKGTGLGLSTAYGIVKQSGGYIWADSVEGQGSTFRVYLPRARPARGEPDAPRERAREAEPGRETILLVEDEGSVRDLACRILEKRGYRVLTAGSGDEALELVASLREPIDLVVSDVVMPRLSGPAMVERLRDRLPALPVVFISGYTDDAVMRHGPLGGTHFLQKPFAPDQLARAVRAALDD